MLFAPPRHSATPADTGTSTSRRTPAINRWPWLVAALVVLAAGVWACRSVIVDDTFITYRYSANLANGFGPTWNPGQDPVEGYTNFAWMAWHAAWVWTGVPLTVVSKLTSVVCAVGLVWLLVREPDTRAGIVVAAGGVLVFLPSYAHITAGLETAAYALVVLRAVVVAARVLTGRAAPAVWELPALLLLAGLLRPDGLIAVAPSFAVWLWANRRNRQAWVWTAAAGLAGAAYMAWRWTYFGHALPNTFVVKAIHEARFNEVWINNTVPLLLPLLILAGAAVIGSDTRRGLLATTTVAAVWVIPAATAPAMDYGSRFAWHALPVLALAAAWAIDRIDQRSLAATAATASLVWVAATGLFMQDDTRSIVNSGPDFDRAQAAIGRGLARADVPAGQRTLATAEAGAIPYRSGWQSIDYGGLSDEAIARGADPAEVVQSSQPSVIVVCSPDTDVPPMWWGMDVARGTAGYELADTVPWRGGFTIHLFTRPGLAQPVRDSIRAEVAAAVDRGDGRTDYSYRRWLDRVL